MTVSDLGLLLIGFILGILASIFAGIWLSFRQFEASTAGYRVRMVTDATRQIVEAARSNSDIGVLQNKYRYSLGVLINELTIKFGEKNFAPGGPWPVTVDCDKDRWDRFNTYVRPVIEDINIYAFVGELHKHRLPNLFFSFFYDDQLTKRLSKLNELCHQIETIVGLLDAACEGNRQIVSVKDGAIFPNSNKGISEIQDLVEEHKKLHEIWSEWLKLTLQD